MNDAVTKLLTIQVAMKGINQVESAFLSFMRMTGATSAQLAVLQSRFTALAPSLGLATAAIAGLAAEGAKWQTMQVRLEAFTGSASKASDEMEMIEKIASKGVFKFDDIAKAVDRLNAMQIPLKENLDLVERLGARSGNLGGAADIVAAIAGGRGTIPRLVNRIRTELRISPQQLSATGLNVSGSTIHNSPAQILDALKKIEQLDPLLNNLQFTFGAQAGGMLFNVTKIMQMLSGPTLYALQTLLVPINYILEGFIEINRMTGGILGDVIGFVVMVAAFERIAALWTLIAKSAVATKIAMTVIKALSTSWNVVLKVSGFLWDLLTGKIKLATFWQNALKWATAVWNVISTVAIAIWKLITGQIAIADALTAVLDALTGNWENLAAGLAIAAIVGIGWVGFNAANSGNGGIDGTHPSNRPHRRDDIENVYKKAYGKSWTG